MSGMPQLCGSSNKTGFSRLPVVTFVFFCELFGKPCYTNFIKAKSVGNDFMGSTVTNVQMMGHFVGSHLSFVQSH